MPDSNKRKTFHADIVIYGTTSAGVIAAVQAKRMGKSAIVVGPDKHLGGLSSSGLGFTDTGDKTVIGGLAREFYHRVWLHYDAPKAWQWQPREDFGNRGQGAPAIDGENRTMWLFEPHVAEKIFEDLVTEYEIPVHRDTWLDREQGVEKVNGRIVSLSMLDGRIYKAKVFIDATYEGDLMAAAGVSHHIGREANSVYGERWNGVQIGVYHHHHYFHDRIDPYVNPGDPSSGLLAEISSEPPGHYGEADNRIQAYCYRMCLTNVPENRKPFPKPERYDPSRYELLLRVYERGWRDHLDKYDLLPNGKTDTNNCGPFSTDYIGANYEYPDADYACRAEIVQDHEDYQKGLMYFVTNDPRVPESIRNDLAEWGLAKDEFIDNGNWPYQLYVREARRMIGEHVMTEHEVIGGREVPDPIGLGSYHLDSHNVQRYVTCEGHVQNEGDVAVDPPHPYAISYRSITPKRVECENLLVPVCLSSSHIAYGSIRMEPVFMILGESAATAASLAIEASTPVQDVPYKSIREHLLSQQQELDHHSMKPITQHPL